ncbi:MAG TPA: FtsX-like permease family protein [Candidatus Limnocylindrales bacterium]|nr:FtsX-like permease family protein [Candidatus Limnocylindrales bacterium]
MSTLGAAGLLLRQIRNERGGIVLTVVLVAVTSFACAAAPRLFNRVSAEALRYALESAPLAQRTITLTLTSSIAPGTGDGVSSVRDRGATLEADFPTSVAALISERSLRFTAARFTVVDPPRYDTRITLSYVDGLADAMTLVAGRWPADRGMPLVPLSEAESSDGEPAELAIIEAAISVATANEIGVAVGDRLAIEGDGSDPAMRFRDYRLVPAAIEVVGLYEPLDPAAEAWSGDTDLLAAIQGGSDFHPIAYAAAYVSPEAYPSLWVTRLPFQYAWRSRVDPERLDASTLPQLQDGLRRLTRTESASPGAPDAVTITTGLPAIVDRFAAERALTAAVLSVAAIGPFGLAGGAIAMLAILAVRRRARSLVLARSRGASRLLVLGTQLWQGALQAGSAAIVGLLLATALIAAYDSQVSPLLAAAIAVGSVILIGAATWAETRRPLGALARDDPPGLRVAPRRLVVEVTVVVIAAAATLLLRQRGLLLDEATGVTRFDPLLASVPVLSGLAAGIVLVRLYPLPIRALGWLAARRRDIVPILGLRSIGRHPAAASVPLLVLMLTVGFGAFSSVVAWTVGHGQVVASYLAVGADYRLEHVGIGALAPSLDPAAVPGVEAVAEGVVDPSGRFWSSVYPRAPMFIEAIDPPGYQAVASGSPAAPDWPGPFLVQPVGAVGTAEQPIPAILSQRVPTGTPSLAPGDTFSMEFLGEELVFSVAERRATFPGVAGERPFTVVPINWLRAATGRLLPPSVLWLRAGDDAAAQLADAVAAAPGLTRIVSRYEALAAHTAAPFSGAVVVGYWLAFAIAAAYMAFTVIGALVLSAERRTRDLTYLRPLGFTARQALGLAFMEHGPLLLLAVVPGIAFGLGVAILCIPGLGLATFVGSVGDVPVFVDWPALAVLAGGLLAATAAAVAGGTWLAGWAQLRDSLRNGEN